MDSLIGQNIKGYEIQECIGEGGFGAVYRAYQSIVKREVAIKVILPEFANQPDFIRRFEFEAQLIARLEHPHIVPLYDYWRESDHAYLVMRALSSNLGAQLEKGPWSVEDTGRLLDQIAAALTVAHRHGVIHRDIKPDNILLDEDQNAYLADFGIATTYDQDARPVTENFGLGSVAYIAPEQLVGKPVTAQSDLFSLGILIFQMLTNKLPFAEATTLVDLIDRQLDTPLPPLSTYRADLPESINAVIQRATDKNPGQRYPDAMSMAAAFRQAISGISTPPVSVSAPPAQPINPYKGLRAFEEADAVDFFGRTTLIERLVKRLNEPEDGGHFLAVIGPSGSGKSSVIHAGLLTALRRNERSAKWFRAEMVPGPQPLKNLEAAILGVAVNPPNDLLTQFQSSDFSFARVIESVIPPDIDLLLVIDQFEEIFTLVSDELERVHFLNCLVNAVTNRNGRLHLVIALRADFVDRPLHYAAFGELIHRHNEFVLPLSPEELEQVIVGPAEHAGIRVEPELKRAIVDEVAEQSGALPLLQYALTELFEHQDSGVLTLGQYREMGGVMGILARQAEDLYIDLDEASQKTVQQLFLRLVASGEGMEDTRRRVGRAELASLGVEHRRLDYVLEMFSRRRLLTFDNDIATRRPTVEIAHEALIRTWPRLQEWLNATRDEARIQRRLIAAASEWNNAKRDPSFLADGARLDQYETWLQQTTLAVGEEEAEFVRASARQRHVRQVEEQARKARELRMARLAANFQRITLGLAVVGVLALVAVVALGIQGSHTAAEMSRMNRLVATAQTNLATLGLAAEANKILISEGGNVELATLLSIRALKIAYLPEADSLLRQAIERNYTTQVYAEHTGSVYAVAYSPDGNYAVSGGTDKVARLWDIQTGKTIQIFKGHYEAITSVAFSADGKYVLTGSSDTTARLWDIKTGQTVRVFGRRIVPVFTLGSYSAINSVAISTDGNYVVTSGRDTQVRLWDVKTAQIIRSFEHTSGVFGVAFSPDGNYIVAGTTDKYAAIWDLRTGKQIQTLKGHTSAIWSVAFSPDSKTVITGSGDNTARLWDVQTGQIIHVFKGHLSDVTAVQIAPSGKYAATTSTDGTARIWDIQTGEVQRILSGHTGSLWSAAFSPDSTALLTGSDDHTVRQWDVRVDRSPYTFASHTAAIWSLAISSDGKSILTGSEDGTARVWDVKSGQSQISLSDRDLPIYSAAYSSDGRYILLGMRDGLAEMWDAQTGIKLKSFQAPGKDAIYAVAFSPDGKYILSAGVDSTARLWNIQAQTIVQTYKAHTGPIDAAAFSPDGKYILTGSYDQRAILWATQSGEPLKAFSQHEAVVTSVAFSPDGQYFATGGGDNIVRLWSMATQGIVHQFVGHSASVSSVAFSRDSQRIVSGSANAVVLIWDIQSGSVLRTFEGHTKGITSVAFAPDGSFVASASTDNTVRIWETDYREFINYACSHLRTDFSDEDRQRFNLTDKTPTCPQFVRKP